MSSSNPSPWEKPKLRLVGEGDGDAAVFPLEGTIFVGRAPYADQKFRKAEQKIRKMGGWMLAALVALSYLSWAAPSPEAAPSVFKLGLILIFLLLPMNAGTFRDYFTLRKICEINPLMKMDHDGISLWSRPDETLPWNEVGVFVRKASKIYALPRMAVFQPDRPHPALIEIDAALLDVKREDLLAYLTSRLAKEHQRGAH